MVRVSAGAGANAQTCSAISEATRGSVFIRKLSAASGHCEQASAKRELATLCSVELMAANSRERSIEFRAKTDDVEVALCNSEFREKAGTSLKGNFLPPEKIIQEQKRRTGRRKSLPISSWEIRQSNLRELSFDHLQLPEIAGADPAQSKWELLAARPEWHPILANRPPDPQCPALSLACCAAPHARGTDCNAQRTAGRCRSVGVRARWNRRRLARAREGRELG